MLAKCKKELLDGGFIYETVKGHRPNKASWYAITWQTLDRLSGYDYGAEQGFKKGAYNPPIEKLVPLVHPPDKKVR